MIFSFFKGDEGRGRRRVNRRRRPDPEPAAGGRRWRLPGLPSALQLLLTALVVYAGYQLQFLLFEASYFKLKAIEVVGVEKVAEETVLRYSGLSLGQLAFNLEPEEVEKRVRVIPRIASCKVLQPSPNRVLLEVTEKPEVARLVLDGRIFEVGPEGEIMAEASPESRTPLLLDAEIEEGPPRRLSERHLLRMKQWFPVLGEPPTESFTRVRFGGGGRLDVYWRGIRLVVDDVARFLRHRRFLGPVLADARERGKGFEYIDLRFQDVVVRFAPLETGRPAPTVRAEISPPVAEHVAAGAGIPQNGRQVPEIHTSELDEFMRGAAAVYASDGGAGNREAGNDL